MCQYFSGFSRKVLLMCISREQIYFSVIMNLSLALMMMMMMMVTYKCELCINHFCY